MANHWLNKTTEERKEIARKGFATRRAKKLALAKARHDALIYRDGLRGEIDELESRLFKLKRLDGMVARAELDVNYLLRECEIAGFALPWKKSSGVYFLVDGTEVVYVGQAVNVYARITQHEQSGKKFDRYAYIPCPIEMLDKVESLYIHYLMPRLNGTQCNGAKCSPIPLSRLLGGMNA